MHRTDDSTLSGGHEALLRSPSSPSDPPLIGLLAVDVSADGEKAVLALAGELDLATVDRAERGLERALSSSPSGRVVVDLRELTFICSTGIRFLSGACREGDRKVTVIESEAPGVRRVLEIVGLDLDRPGDVGEALDRPRNA